MTRKLVSGWSLLELAVGLAIASIALTGALSLFVHGRALLDANDSVSRLQDQARHALSVVVQDLERAGSHGFGFDPGTLRVVQDGDLSHPIAVGAALRQGAPPIPLPSTTHGSIHDCGSNFAFDLSRQVEASNNHFALGIEPANCAPTASAGGAAPDADTLTVRYSTENATPAQGRLQLYSNRFATHSGQALYLDGRAPGAQEIDQRSFDVVVRTYYVARNSVDRAGWPALRAKTLTAVAGAPGFRDEEILPGVEDLQVQFGIADSPPSGAVTRFVNPDATELLQYPPRAVRIWMRIRADSTQRGYRDDRAWRYADTEFAPSPAELGFRRMLVSRTVALRTPGGS